ncbi:MAG: hypothetical protein M1827_005515 [Pycnora praestabilis]|nr:MAG: hypothetical protein M1827_005515 [Pycnora praestabilis]
MSTLRSILVLGTGELGTSVLRELIERAPPSTRVTVLLGPTTLNSNNRSTQHELTELLALGIKFLPGDIANHSRSQLSTVFKPFHTVIDCSDRIAGNNVRLKIAHAALDAGIECYISWQFGVNYEVIGRGTAQNLFDEQLDVRDLLHGQDRTAWIILSTGIPTNFLFQPSFGVVDMRIETVRALGDWKNAVTITTPKDIGILISEIVFGEPKIRNQVVYSGGDTITYERLANVVEEVLNRRVQRIVWRVSNLQEELAKDPDNALKKYRVVFAQGKGVSWNMRKTLNAQRGIGFTGVEQWLRAN